MCPRESVLLNLLSVSVLHLGSDFNRDIPNRDAQLRTNRPILLVTSCYIQCGINRDGHNEIYVLR